RIVLKVANAIEDRAIVEAQQRAITHLAARLDTTPRVLSTLNGRALAEATGPGGAQHLLWAISWLNGVPLARVRYRSLALFHDVGRHVGALQHELLDFDHP